MGCLLAILAGVFPRLAMLIVWIARPDHWGASGTQRNQLPGRRPSQA